MTSLCGNGSFNGLLVTSDLLLQNCEFGLSLLQQNKIYLQCSARPQPCVGELGPSRSRFLTSTLLDVTVEDIRRRQL